VRQSALNESPCLTQGLEAVRRWIETRQFAGYEPFDLLNSPYLRHLSLAHKALVFLQRGQLESGGWYYGRLRRQRWIDGFHTSYNVCALLDYERFTGDRTFKDAMLLGHRYYKATFFTDDGAPKYFMTAPFPSIFTPVRRPSCTSSRFLRSTPMPWNLPQRPSTGQ
jgi:hypothetical protein